MTQSASPPSVLSDSLPTMGQLERQLSQMLQSSYGQWMGHSPSHVLCHIVGRVVNILLQDSITPLETLLHDSQENFIRDSVNEKIRRFVADLVTEVCGVPTDSVMLDSNTDNGLTGIIILLAAKPEVRTRKRRTTD